MSASWCGALVLLLLAGALPQARCAGCESGPGVSVLTLQTAQSISVTVEPRQASLDSAPRQATPRPSAPQLLLAPHVPRFAGKPCVAEGHCPTGPNCTIWCVPSHSAALRAPVPGQYCGPGWCGGSCVNEGRQCDFSVEPQAGSCTDSCCRVHDMCCGCSFEGDEQECDRSQCNTELAACLSSCSWSDGCTGDDGRWGPSVIELVFKLDKRRCCGGRCPDDPPASAPGALAAA